MRVHLRNHMCRLLIILRLILLVHRYLSDHQIQMAVTLFLLISKMEVMLAKLQLRMV